MNTTIPRVATSFRLRSDLIERLKASALRANRSLNNYVESLLLEMEFNLPNADTRDAIIEAKRGGAAGKLNMTDFESFMKDVNEID